MRHEIIAARNTWEHGTRVILVQVIMPQSCTLPHWLRRNDLAVEKKGKRVSHRKAIRNALPTPVRLHPFQEEIYPNELLNLLNKEVSYHICMCDRVESCNYPVILTLLLNKKLIWVKSNHLDIILNENCRKICTTHIH